ncbi:hypothetical protein Patl1_04394 [Pistacia atlantica]|uniref:Uncharacterized protein n=1 Tax=Pistacia atlantica TaxID=434234 RepID=A0ACC1BWM6_9ROSI|nr:hypothetical protein Patl1_04394 [Pistacia atlantica]
MIVKMIQEQMGVMRAGCYIFLVVLLCGSLMVTSEYMTTSEEMFLSRLVNPETGEVDNVMIAISSFCYDASLGTGKHALESWIIVLPVFLCLHTITPSAELLWISCREHLIHLEEVVEDLNLCLPEEKPGSTNEMKSTSQPLTKGNIQKLENCAASLLEANSFTMYKKGQAFVSCRNWALNHVGELLKPLPMPQAHPLPLALPLPLAPAPAPAPLAPGPMPSLVSKPSPPPPSSSTAFFPVDSSPPPAIVTAAVTFFLAALLFFCCRRLRNGGDRRNDERPLLSVSMSDYSVGNSIKGEKLGHQSLDGKFAALEAIGGTTKSSADSLDTSSNINGRVLPPLKPPPGRPDATPLGMPALKPPPGRAEPLPPEPPASLRPPAPPRPPPPIKSSESTGPLPLNQHHLLHHLWLLV